MGQCFPGAWSTPAFQASGAFLSLISGCHFWAEVIQEWQEAQRSNSEVSRGAILRSEAIPSLDSLALD